MELAPVIQISDDVPVRSKVEELVEARASRLDRFHARITSCDVLVELHSKHHSAKHPLRVRIVCKVPPGQELIVDRPPEAHDAHTPNDTVIRHAFQAMERQLRDLSDKQHDHDGADRGAALQTE